MNIINTISHFFLVPVPTTRENGSGELAQMAKSKAAKLEWLLLQRLAPEAARGVGPC